MQNKGAKKTFPFAICITDTEPDLELRKVYQVMPDASDARSKYLRVVDESGEDYLYPASFFVSIQLPPTKARALLPSS